MPDASAVLTKPNPPATAPTTPRDYRFAKLIAIVAGVLGALFALATPFLPVQQTQAEVSWPQGGSLDPVQAALMSQVPIDANATIPCSAVQQLDPRGGILLATAPPQGKGADLEALFVRVSGESVDVLDRNAVVASATRTEMSQCSQLVITSDSTQTYASFEGVTRTVEKPTADGGRELVTVPVEGRLLGDLRPQVVGVFTDMKGGVPAGLSFHMTVDSRFSSSPTVIKLVAIIAAVLLTLLAMGALAVLDTSDGRGHRRILPAHWLKPTWADGGIIGTLLLWHFVGANTSDDGYILTMVRAAPHAGYLANYFRWFGVPEAPFGWYYYVIQAFAEVSTASPWVRIPALLCGILCWLVISREVVPRLGNAVAKSQVALWTGGLVFLAFWLPYDNGLRSEPIVALGALLTWVSIERAIATSRLLPAAVAVLVAAFTLAAAPTGLMCVAALLAGIRPLVRIVVRRRKQFGDLALLAPISAAGFLVLVAVFADQTFAGIMEANRVRQVTGPNLAWYEDYLRYYYLFVETVDGSLARRFAFLLMILCLITTMLVLLRRRQVPGIASAPTWRLMGVVFGTIFFMMFNPTKWTHHFGSYAGIAGSLAAVTAVAVSATALRSRKNRSVFLAGLLFTLAVAFSGINGYWYVSSYGVPWFDKTVSLHGFQSNTLMLVLFGLALAVVAWQSLREGYAKPMANGKTKRGRRIRKFAAIPLTVVAALMVLFEVVSLLKGAVQQYPAYSLARSNIDAVTGNTCGLANDVLVEGNVNSGNLTPIADPAHPPQNGDPLAGESPVGFSPNGVADKLDADSVEVKPGTGNTSTQTVGPAFEKGQNAGTGGGKGAQGVNGSTVALPFGLDPATTPVMGSYQDGVQQPAELTSSWYQLPPRSDDSPLIVISAAGRVMSFDDTGNMTYGQDIFLEYGHHNPDGTVTFLDKYRPLDVGPAPSWRNLRIPRSALPDNADAVRIYARDPILIGDQWLAFTPPRVPKLVSLNSYLGSTQPILLDWAVGLQFPCQHPFDHRNGVVDAAPKYRILPDRPLAISSTNTWQAEEFGGPLGWAEMLSASKTVPTYLKDNYARDWGSLEQYEPFYPDPSDPAKAKFSKPAQVDTHVVTRSGFWSPGKMRVF
ncbi:arabinosyltransferase domain-containing protein [Nocardia sp. NPDC059228]|uniref:arabinosyltransferase domain-containing protein n=1 Tax=Nocardia sp. NPDC059228 TaxID=3346777 RepID=UPI0036927EAB